MTLSINTDVLILVVGGMCLVILLVVGLTAGSPTRRRRLTKEEKAHVWIKAGKKCRYCGVPIPRPGSRSAHYDHVKPLAQGGSNRLDNIVLACRACNLKKGNKTPQQAHMRSPNGSGRSWVALLVIIGAVGYIWITVLHHPIPVP